MYSVTGFLRSSAPIICIIISVESFNVRLKYSFLRVKPYLWKIYASIRPSRLGRIYTVVQKIAVENQSLTAGAIKVSVKYWIAINIRADTIK